jgi:hypothetical protein
MPDTEDTRALVQHKKAEYIGEDDENTAPEGYEAQNVRSLESLAKERGIDIPRGTKKGEIIEFLKAWDAEHAGGDGDGGDS